MNSKTLAHDGLSAIQHPSISLNEVDTEVIRAIRGIRYGSVEIVIHDSRVVQIERKEKRRFDASGRIG